MGEARLFVKKTGAGFPILMLHGFPLDHRSILPFEQYFPAHGLWLRYYIDLPGMGQSQGFLVRSVEDVLDVLSQFIDREFGHREFAVTGYSFGGLLAPALAERYGQRIRSLFLLAPELVPEHDQRTLPKRVVYHESDLPSNVSKQEISIYRSTAVVESSENFNLFKRYVLPGLVENMERPIFRYLIDNPSLPKTSVEYLRGYRQPVTIVTGEHDTMVGYEDAFAVYRTLHDAEYVVLPRAGHNLHLDQPEAVKQLFEQWLAELRANIG